MKTNAELNFEISDVDMETLQNLDKIKDDGAPKLVAKEISWINGWPKVEPME